MRLDTGPHHRLAGNWMIDDVVPFGKPVVASEINTFASTALQNHPGVGSTRPVSVIGMGNNVFRTDERLAATPAVWAVPFDDFLVARHAGIIAQRIRETAPVRAKVVERVRPARYIGGSMVETQPAAGSAAHIR